MNISAQNSHEFSGPLHVQICNLFHNLHHQHKSLAQRRTLGTFCRTLGTFCRGILGVPKLAPIMPAIAVALTAPKARRPGARHGLARLSMPLAV